MIMQTNQTMTGRAMIECLHSPAPVEYRQAVALMEEWAGAIRRGACSERLWFLTHPPVYTAGTSAKSEDLKDSPPFPVIKTGRGGQFTYHGPGQRVVYVMLDLDQDREGGGRDVRAFVARLERWIITALAEFGIHGETRSSRIGVWIPAGQSAQQREAKIAAIGIRLRRWVTFHGISINVDPDLDHYAGIVPCGLADYAVTSLAAEGHNVSMAALDQALRAAFQELFAPLADVQGFQP